MAANITDIILTDNTQCRLNSCMHVKYIHSNSKLTERHYCFVGEVPIEDLDGSEQIVVIDAYSYQQRSISNGRIIRLRTGGYIRPIDNAYCSLKLVGITIGSKLFLVTEESKAKVRDISSRAPVRQAGIFGAIKKIQTTARFSSSEKAQNIA